MAKLIPEAVKPAPQAVRLPPGLDEKEQAELLAFFKKPVRPEWHGNDPRYNQRVIVRVRSNYPTYVGKDENEFLHRVGVNGEHHEFPVDRWTALPLTIVESIARRADDYHAAIEEKAVDHRAMMSGGMCEVGRTSFRMRLKYSIEVWGDVPEADGLKWSPTLSWHDPEKLKKAG